MKLLHERRNQFKAAALQAKKSGDMATATEYVRIMKVSGAILIINQKYVT